MRDLKEAEKGKGKTNASLVDSVPLGRRYWGVSVAWLRVVGTCGSRHTVRTPGVRTGGFANGQTLGQSCCWPCRFHEGALAPHFFGALFGAQLVETLAAQCCPFGRMFGLSHHGPWGRLLHAGDGQRPSVATTRWLGATRTPCGCPVATYRSAQLLWVAVDAFGRGREQAIPSPSLLLATCVRSLCWDFELGRTEAYAIYVLDILVWAAQPKDETSMCQSWHSVGRSHSWRVVCVGIGTVAIKNKA